MSEVTYDGGWLQVVWRGGDHAAQIAHEHAVVSSSSISISSRLQYEFFWTWDSC